MATGKWRTFNWLVIFCWYARAPLATDWSYSRKPRLTLTFYRWHQSRHVDGHKKHLYSLLSSEKHLSLFSTQNEWNSHFQCPALQIPQYIPSIQDVGTQTDFMRMRMQVFCITSSDQRSSTESVSQSLSRRYVTPTCIILLNWSRLPGRHLKSRMLSRHESELLLWRDHEPVVDFTPKIPFQLNHITINHFDISCFLCTSNKQLQCWD